MYGVAQCCPCEVALRCFTADENQKTHRTSNYGETCLKQTTKGTNSLPAVDKCPLYRGYACQTLKEIYTLR